MIEKRLSHKCPIWTCQNEINGVDGQKEDMQMKISTLLKFWVNDYFDNDDKIDDQGERCQDKCNYEAC